MAILNPSMATILRLFSSISMSTPVIAPLFSSILAAKEVFFIMSFKISLLNTSSSEFSSLGFMLGNSSAESPIILNSELEHFIFTFPSVSSTIISPSGSFLIISPNNLERTTISPGLEFSTFIFFSMLRSRSEADIVNIPLSSTFKRIPFKIGIVVLIVTALDTIFKALVRVCWLQENFIRYLRIS